MTAVNHDSGNEISCVILFFAEGAIVFVEEFVDELIDFVSEKVWRVLSLLEKEGGRVLKLLHIQIFILNKLNFLITSWNISLE